MDHLLLSSLDLLHICCVVYSSCGAPNSGIGGISDSMPYIYIYSKCIFGNSFSAAHTYMFLGMNIGDFNLSGILVLKKTDSLALRSH